MVGIVDEQTELITEDGLGFLEGVNEERKPRFQPFPRTESMWSSQSPKHSIRLSCRE
jgi:hypothetical protein